MPTRQLVLSAFVASPSDVTEERGLLEEVIGELNVTWSKSLGIRLDLVRWETHTNPSVGLYPQSVINDQIGDDYDLFIGILWSRFGTATPEAKSGTEEEFRRALARRHQLGNVEIMMYFKDAPVAPSQIDFPQMKLVLDFKRSLGEEGVYHWSFTNRDQFSQFLRVHLSRVVQSWASKNKETVDGGLAHSLSVIPPTLDDELGLFDHIEAAELSFERANTCMDRLVEAIEDIGSAFRIRTDEVNEVNSRGLANLREAKQVAQRSASDLSEFSSRIDAEIPIFAANYRTAMEHMAAAATLSVTDFTPNLAEIEKVERVLELQHPAIDGAIKSTLQFRGSIAKMPRLTVVFNKARRGALQSLDKLHEEFEFALRISADCRGLVGELLIRIREGSS